MFENIHSKAKEIDDDVIEKFSFVEAKYVLVGNRDAT